MLSYSFGDVFLLCRFLLSSGLMACADACGHPSADTVRALLCFYVLTSLANRHAQDWWELTFASLLFPGAKVGSQRVSEVLADLGSEDAKRRFMRAYLALLGKGGGKARDRGDLAEDGGILIDSTGLPSCSRLPCTAVSNHDGEVSEEVRLIYVVQQGTGLPLFFRHVAGDVVLKKIAEIATKVLGDSFVCRYGGEEFVVVLDEQEGGPFLDRLEAFRKAVEDNTVNFEGSILNPTVTIGAVKYREKLTLMQWVELADQKMYTGKKSGKNKIVI
jgi:hypothetical protein